MLDPWGNAYAYVPYYEYRDVNGKYQRGTTMSFDEAKIAEVPLASRPTITLAEFYRKGGFQMMCMGMDKMWDLEYRTWSTSNLVTYPQPASFIEWSFIGKPMKGDNSAPAKSADKGGNDFTNW